MFVAGTVMNTAQSSLPALAAGFYPTQGRATGVAWMLGLGRFGGIAGSFLVAELSRRQLGFGEIFTVVAVPGLVEGVFPTGNGRGQGSGSNGWLSGAFGALPYPLRGDVARLPHWAAEGARSDTPQASTSGLSTPCRPGPQPVNITGASEESLHAPTVIALLQVPGEVMVMGGGASSRVGSARSVNDG